MQPTEFNYSNTNVNKPRRGMLLMIVFGFLVLVLLITLLVKHFLVDKTLTIESRPGYTISVGTPSGAGEPVAIVKLIKKSSSSLSLHLASGYYLILFSEGPGYQQVYQSVNLTKNTNVVAPNLDYSAARLSSILDRQSSSIQSSFANSSSGNILNQGYSITNTGVYDKGAWYAGRLVPSSAQNDVLVFVMHNVSGQWKLATAPAIVLYVGDYPNVPASVISSANNYSSPD